LKRFLAPIMAGRKRGPAQQPAAKNRLKGNPDKCLRKTPAAKILPGRPTRPGWLSVEARAEWDPVVPQLAKLKLLCQLYQPLLAAYCQAVAKMRSTSETIAKLGLT
jgi:phage terminase small subunit